MASLSLAVFFLFCCTTFSLHALISRHPSLCCLSKLSLSLPAVPPSLSPSFWWRDSHSSILQVLAKCIILLLTHRSQISFNHGRHDVFDLTVFSEVNAPCSLYLKLKQSLVICYLLYVLIFSVIYLYCCPFFTPLLITFLLTLSLKLLRKGILTKDILPFRETALGSSCRKRKGSEHCTVCHQAASLERSECLDKGPLRKL